MLVCDLNLGQLQARLGASAVKRRGGVVAINGALPVSVLRSFPGRDLPTAPRDLAVWVNRVLGLKPYKGVGRHHPGIERLSKWVAHRLASQPNSAPRSKELLDLARQWLPEFFRGVTVDPEHLKARRTVPTIAVQAAEPEPIVDLREQEALACLDDARARRRVRGLELLARLDDPELFDWCLMFLADEALSVRLAALRGIRRCPDADTALVEPLADSTNKRVRAGAIPTLAVHGGREAPRWLERGLKDPEACVRRAAAGALGCLDPERHHRLFELALYDPNPDVARVARKLTEGKGYGKPTW